MLKQQSTLLLEGSKDPDNRFKDFKNHVLHVKDGYWGGAPEKVQNWYQHLVAALKESNWSEAAYAAGVLSHYYTDPIQPFHTGQTAAENNIHRAVEWSINRSYDALKRIADRAMRSIDVPVREGEGWLKEMTCDGAEFSHRYYEKLIAHYDITRGVTDPPSGLDDIARKFVAELIAYASTGFARILDRAFTESGVTPPDVELALDTLIATLQIPIKMVQKRLSMLRIASSCSACTTSSRRRARSPKTCPRTTGRCAISTRRKSSRHAPPRQRRRGQSVLCKSDTAAALAPARKRHRTTSSGHPVAAPLADQIETLPASRLVARLANVDPADAPEETPHRPALPSRGLG